MTNDRVLDAVGDGDPELRRRLEAVTYGDRDERLRAAHARRESIECPWCSRDSCPGDCDRQTAAVVLDSTAFLSMSLPPREPLIVGSDGSSIVRRKDHVLVFAGAGFGKSMTRDAWAVMLARGGAWVRGWHAPTRRRVLIVDGEMPGAMGQDRLRREVASIRRMRATSGS